MCSASDNCATQMSLTLTLSRHRERELEGEERRKRIRSGRTSRIENWNRKIDRRHASMQLPEPSRNGAPTFLARESATCSCCRCDALLDIPRSPSFFLVRDRAQCASPASRLTMDRYHAVVQSCDD